MQISDEAVEAAARAYREQQAELGYPKWEDLPEDGREWRREFMRAALEAAATHMLADAWESGADAYYSQLSKVSFGFDFIPNPYRSQA